MYAVIHCVKINCRIVFLKTMGKRNSKLGKNEKTWKDSCIKPIPTCSCVSGVATTTAALIHFATETQSFIISSFFWMCLSIAVFLAFRWLLAILWLHCLSCNGHRRWRPNVFSHKGLHQPSLKDIVVFDADPVSTKLSPIYTQLGPVDSPATLRFFMVQRTGFTQETIH